MKRIIDFTSLAVLWVFVAGTLTAKDQGPPIFQVSADGRAKYSSVQAAIDAAPAKAVVRIGPGTFKGPVQISKPLTLEGAGSDRTFLIADWVNSGECLVEGKGVPAASQARYQRMRKIAVDQEHGEGPVSEELWRLFGPKPSLTVKNTSDVIVRGLSISMPGSVQTGGWQHFHMVLLEDAGATMEGCALVGSAVDGVEISGQSTVSMRNCLIGGIRSYGIVVKASSTSKVQFEDCDVRGCYGGFHIKSTGDVKVTHCRISRVVGIGIHCDDSLPTITGNVFSDMSRFGIHVRGKSKGMISDNLFLDCETSGSEDQIVNNTFVLKTDPSPERGPFSAIDSRGTQLQVIRHNVISGYDHAFSVSSTAKQPADRDSKKFEDNLCDTSKSAIVHVHRTEPKNSKEPPEKPEIHDLPLPDGNWKIAVKFTDPEHGDYSLSDKLEWPNVNLGARKHAALASPWSEQPAERGMLDRIKDAEGKRR